MTSSGTSNSSYTTRRRSPYFPIMDGLNRDNLSDHKVAMVSEIDMSSGERLRARLAAEGHGRPSYTALVIRAISLALRASPEANRIPLKGLFGTRIVQLQQVDVSVAVERDSDGREQAVFAGTLRSTDAKDVSAISSELRGLAQAAPETCARWRQFQWVCEKLPAFLALKLLRIPKWSPRLWIAHRGGAVLVSSPAKYGVDLMMGAWPWPLGFSFGFVKERPVVVDGQVVARPTMALTMSFDRRLMAGAPAARFFRLVADHLEQARERLAPELAEEDSPRAALAS